MDMTGNVTQMVWKPALMRLTHVPIPPTVDHEFDVFVDAQAISFIGRATPTHNHPDGTQTKGSECTMLHCCHYQLFVNEPPHVVAAMRDRALGHEVKPKAAGCQTN